MVAATPVRPVAQICQICEFVLHIDSAAGPPFSLFRLLYEPWLLNPDKN